jgi:hypothetical protein
MCGVVLAGAGLGLRAVADGDGVTARHERGSFVVCGEWHRISPTHNATIKCAFTYYVLTSSIDEIRCWRREMAVIRGYDRPTGVGSGTKMSVKTVLPVVLAAAMTAFAAPTFAGADTVYVGVAVGYRGGGIPYGVPFVSSTAEGAKQGSMLNCRTQLASCVSAGTSTQCIGIATGLGTKWESAEGPDGSAARANARAKLADLVYQLPLPDPPGAGINTMAACPSGDVAGLSS